MVGWTLSYCFARVAESSNHTTLESSAARRSHRHRRAYRNRHRRLIHDGSRLFAGAAVVASIGSELEGVRWPK